MSYGTDLAELSAQIETARAALAAVERLARQLQQRAEAQRAAKWCAGAPFTEVEAMRSAQAEQADPSCYRVGGSDQQTPPPIELGGGAPPVVNVPPLVVNFEPEPASPEVKRGRGRPVGAKDSYKRPPRSKAPEVAMHRRFA